MYNNVNYRLRCLNCHHGPLRFDTGMCVCSECGSSYPIINATPILIKIDNEIFPQKAFLSGNPKSEALCKRRLVANLGKFLPRISVNLSSERIIHKIATLLGNKPSASILVVGGGKQRMWLDKRFANYPNIRLIYTDIDRDALVDYFCDAHDLPFMDDTFDCVITTAVLQHVFYPETAISEIYRVLKPDAIVYSEMAFMQQVIEGAYDFTRYTLSGHRRIFNHFDEIASGMVAGPGTALVWAIENFALAFVGNRILRLAVKSLVRLLFFWIKYFDYFLIASPQAMDGASCTFFLGRKQFGRVPDEEIIKRYTGGKHLEHI